MITNVYGLRPGAPVTWAEIEGTLPRFALRTIWERLEQVGDLFGPILSGRTSIR